MAATAKAPPARRPANEVMLDAFLACQELLGAAQEVALVADRPSPGEPVRWRVEVRWPLSAMLSGFEKVSGVVREHELDFTFDTGRSAMVLRPKG